MQTTRFYRSTVIAALGLAAVVYGAPSQAAVITDNFNDNSLNTSLWTPSSTDATVEEVNGQLEVTQGSSSAVSGVTLNIHVTGNFDAEVDYRLLNWPDNNRERLGLGALMASGGGVVERLSDSNFGGESYLTHFQDGVQGQTPTTDRSGRLRLTRTGDTLAGYFWTGSTWQLVHSYTNPVNAQDAYVALQAWPGFPISSGVKIAFDNFRLDAPQVVPAPATGLLLLTGLGVIAGFGSGRRQRQPAHGS